MKKNQSNEEEKVNIINFRCDDSFFFQVTKIKTVLPKIKPNINLDITDEDLTIIRNEINSIENTIVKKGESCEIDIIPFYLEKINNLHEMKRDKSIYSERIKKILSDYSGQKRLTLKLISSLYNEYFSEPISQMMVSRILRYNLNLHYRKTIFKNPKIAEKNYILMSLLFLKGIIRSIKLELNLVYIDESGFCLNNTNGKVWRKNKEEILGGPKVNTKNRINLLLAINTKEIIYGQYYKNETITSNEFLDFLNELISRIDDNKIKNTIIILDNAKIHITENVKQFCKQKHLKFLFIVPYKSQYNAIEYCFNLMKNNIYNENITTIKKLKKRLEELINDEKISTDVRKLYKLALEEYLGFLKENKGKHNFNDIYNDILNKKRKRK